jgi:4-hydroxy-tetrahydrodipicolinate synthase
MTRRPLSRPLHGIIPPMVTPLLDPQTLDRAGLSRLVERMIGGGVHGLFVLGTTGEGPGLSYRLRRELIETTCQIVSGRVPVLVAITDTSVEESLNLGDWAADCGADAVITAAPYYFAVSQGDLYRLVECLSTRLALPLYLYNMPSLTKASFAPETVARASQLDNVYGIKDSSGDLEYIRAITTVFRDRKDFSILVGPEELLVRSMALGAHGGVNGGANLFPRLFVRLYEAVVAGDRVTVETLRQRVAQLGQILYRIGEPESSYLRGLKLGLHLMGICSSEMVSPFQPAERSNYETLHRFLNQLDQL